MSKKLKKLASLISLSFAANAGANADIEKYNSVHSGNDSANNTIAPSILNESVSQQLAAHRSHSSHGSHRSSSSGSGTYRPPATPRPSAPRTPSPPRSDPLGQPSRSPSSYPSEQPKALKKNLSDPQKFKNIILRVQLSLEFQGYYSGPIDGVMGPETRAAVLRFKKAKGVSGNKVLDAATLNALGVKAY